jgi:hypothetical protein
MKRTIIFALFSMGGIVAGLLALWALTGFSSFGLDRDDLSFLLPGVVMTILLTVGLMAAMVYSDRSGTDKV